MGAAIGAALFAAVAFGAAALLRQKRGYSPDKAGCLGFFAAILICAVVLLGGIWVGIIR